MSTWASRRRAIYAGSVVIVLTIIFSFVFWKYWYAPPSCSDGIRNGDEEGIDCGGSCRYICSSDALPPVVRSDPRLFEVVPGVYSVITFIENHNINSRVSYLPYEFKIYDSENNLIYTREGVTVLPTNKTTTIFEGNIVIPSNRDPRRAEFNILGRLAWTKVEEEQDELDIRHTPLLREDVAPRIEAEVISKSIRNLENVEVIAVVFDAKDNAIAASRTFIDKLPKNESTDIFFTWPRAFDLGERACEQNSSIVLALDRSGSMASISDNPPEPLTSVKNAASYFVSLLKEGDSAGVVSFATEARVDASLSDNFSYVEDSIDSVSIASSGTQFTNIVDALSKATNQLTQSNNDKNKVVVLLTDGVANKPDKPGGADTEEEQVIYAEGEAIRVADTINQSGISLYTIGLGDDIHHDFLRQLASTDSSYYHASSTDILNNIYTQVSSSICKERPARIEISYKILE